MKIIPILSVGGSFEKIYGTGSKIVNFTFPKDSVVHKIVENSGLSKHVDITYDQDRAKDSLDMDDADRTYIIDWCNKNDRSVVIHGTDTMIETATALANKLILGKTVIFTGSSQPASMRNSDAEFNLGGAIIAAQSVQPGVYIAMNGQVFPYNKCRKNPETGCFEAI